jgi:cell division protein FtsB
LQVKRAVLLLKAQDMSCLQCAAINLCFMSINKGNARQAIASGAVTLLVNWLATGLYSLHPGLEERVLSARQAEQLVEVKAEFARLQAEDAKKKEQEEKDKKNKPPVTAAAAAAAAAAEVLLVMSPHDAQVKARALARLAVVDPPR